MIGLCGSSGNDDGGSSNDGGVVVVCVLVIAKVFYLITPHQMHTNKATNKAKTISD